MVEQQQQRTLGRTILVGAALLTLATDVRARRAGRPSPPPGAAGYGGRACAGAGLPRRRRARYDARTG